MTAKRGVRACVRVSDRELGEGRNSFESMRQCVKVLRGKKERSPELMLAGGRVIWLMEKSCQFSHIGDSMEKMCSLSFSLALSSLSWGFFPMCSRPLVFVARNFFRVIEL